MALLLGIIVVVSSGCESTPTKAPAPASVLSDEATSAAEMLNRASNSADDRAAGLYLDAGWAYLQADDTEGAQLAFDALEPAWLDQSRLSDYHLLAARIALVRNDPIAARTALQQVPGPVRGTSQALLIESQLCDREGDYDCALRSLVEAAGDGAAFNEQIWSYLNRAVRLNAGRAQSREASDAGSGDSATLVAWQALHAIVVDSYSLADAHQRSATWLARNSNHPAALNPPATIAAIAAYRPAPRHIGLLLPLSGPLARAGEAVRDGFIAASLLAQIGSAVRLSVYDTAGEPMPILYERILSDGVDLIVGPLQKETATALNSLNPDVPALVLNYLDEDTLPASTLRQIGLAIEDEASTIAGRLQQDRINNALLFHNYEDWSLRARRTLLESAGARGLTLTIQPITDMRTITEAVGSAMHVAGSQARREQLATILGLELEFLPRARGDVDAVVALIDNGEANALVPALRFHFADQLPVYASSQVTRRTRNRQLAELDGFHVSELPWFLSGDPIYAAMRQAFSLDTNPFASLVALGSDAFRVAERTALAGAPAELTLLGSTGLLRLDADGRIGRELAWGRISRARVAVDTGSTR